MVKNIGKSYGEFNYEAWLWLGSPEALDTKTFLASLPSCSKLHFVVEFTVYNKNRFCAKANIKIKIANTHQPNSLK